MQKNLILIGYRATGKTSISRQLGETLQWNVADSDRLIEQKAKKSIAKIFAEDGEPAFRNLESEVLFEALQKRPLILATGGGLPMREANRILLQQFGKIVWLKASPKTILERMSGDPNTETTRPHLTQLPPFEEIQYVLEQRSPIYREIADLEIDTDQKPPEDIAAQIASWLQKESVKTSVC
ncbi:MAG: shikimate kinase [Planctomycetaceae bacterium]|jgi:shikimate kinase|nr:shikimate kinase [Planctomycetaceae bacterium]